jgi:hypothetical protein
MVKGARRSMIVLRDTDSAIYEEAYFLLREDLKDPLPTPDSLVEEANRIVGGNLLSSSRPKHKSRVSIPPSLLWYLIGLLSGMGFAFLLMF